MPSPIKEREISREGQFRGLYSRFTLRLPAHPICVRASVVGFFAGRHGLELIYPRRFDPTRSRCGAVPIRCMERRERRGVPNIFQRRGLAPVRTLGSHRIGGLSRGSSVVVIMAMSISHAGGPPPTCAEARVCDPAQNGVCSQKLCFQKPGIPAVCPGARAVPIARSSRALHPVMRWLIFSVKSQCASGHDSWAEASVLASASPTLRPAPF